MKKLFSFLLLSIFNFQLSTTHILAAAQVGNANISNLSYPGQLIRNNFNISQLLTISGFNFVTFVFFLIGLAFFFNLIYAGWEYLSSTGDPQKIAGATKRLTNAFTGVIIVLGSFVIIRIILAVLNLPNLI